MITTVAQHLALSTIGLHVGSCIGHVLALHYLKRKEGR